MFQGTLAAMKTPIAVRRPEIGAASSMTRTLLALALAATSLACGRNEYQAPPPPQVTVAEPTVQDVTRYAEFTGTTRAVESVEVRARVKGFLQSMEFEPGEMVEKGQLLFVIDPEPFEVALEAAQAELASNKAELDLSQTEYDRSREMYRSGATSELNLIRARAKRDKAKAAVANSQASIHSAQLDLDYAHVTAPVDGRVGRHLIDIGNLVGAGEATRLTEMVQYSPLYVYFNVSERDVLALQKRSRAEREAQGVDYEDRGRTPIEVRKADETDFPHKGEVDYSALQIDPDTGTFEVRGLLANDGEFDDVIIPGTFVRVRIPIDQAEDALLVSERALGADQAGRYLLVVNSDDVVERRDVELGQRMGEMRVIASGLQPDDRVIVNGLQRARPGAKVAPMTAAEASAKAGEARTAAANAAKGAD